MHWIQCGFSHDKMHLSSWLCHVCGMKFKTLENTCKKALKLREAISLKKKSKCPNL